MKTIHLDKQQFADRIADPQAGLAGWEYRGDKPAVIDFYASWCGPCKALSPVLEETAGKYAEQVYIYKIDVDRNRELAAAYGIRSIPTLFFAGKEGTPEIRIGALDRTELESKINELIGRQ